MINPHTISVGEAHQSHKHEIEPIELRSIDTLSKHLLHKSCIANIQLTKLNIYWMLLTKIDKVQLFKSNDN